MLNAVLLGCVSGARTFAAPGMLALRGRLGKRPACYAVTVLAGGELVYDKHPSAPPRTDAPGRAGRIVTGTVSGAVVAGPGGAVVGGLVAAGSTLLGYHARTTLAARTAVPDPVLGAAEDALAIGLAWFATRDRPRPSLRSRLL